MGLKKVTVDRRIVLDMVTHIDRALPNQARTLFSAICYLAYESVYERMPIPDLGALATDVDEWTVKEAYSRLHPLLPPIEQLLLRLFWDAVGLTRDLKLEEVFWGELPASTDLKPGPDSGVMEP